MAKDKIVVDIEGLKETFKRFEKLTSRKQKATLRKLVRAGASVVNKDIKKNLPTESGLLKKSFTIHVKAYRGSIIAWIGPNPKVSGTFEGIKRVPAKYAHLVENGYTTRSGKMVPGTHTMAKATERNRQAVIDAIAKKFVDSVEKEWNKR